MSYQSPPPAMDHSNQQYQQPQQHPDQNQQQPFYPAPPPEIHQQPEVHPQPPNEKVEPPSYAAGVDPNQQHPQIPQQHQQQQYASASPLYSLQKAAAPVDCPVCRERTLTRTEYVSGGTTHLSAFLCCICVCLGCIPYLVSGLKDVEHHCGNPRCNVLLAVWHRSGHTSVQQVTGA